MQQRSSFDFSAFNALETPQVKREQKRIGLIGFAISVPVLIVAVFIMGRIGMVASDGVRAFAVVATVCLLGVARFASSAFDRVLAVAKAAFVAQNGGSISTSLDLSHEPGVIFSASRRTKLNGSVISGTIDGLPFQQYRCSYLSMDDGGKIGSRATEVLAVGLPRPHPQLIINSLTDTGGQLSLPVRFAKDQYIQLEGNFNRYFAIYAPNGHKIDAVDILAPDVMQTLLDHARPCDIEIVGNRLYFYWLPVQADKETYAKMFAVAEAVLHEIKHKLIRQPETAPDLSLRVAEERTLAGLRTKLNPGIMVWIAAAAVSITVMILLAHGA